MFSSPSAGGTVELERDKPADRLRPASSLMSPILEEVIPGVTSACPRCLPRSELSSVIQSISLMLGSNSPPGNNTPTLGGVRDKTAVMDKCGPAGIRLWGESGVNDRILNTRVLQELVALLAPRSGQHSPCHSLSQALHWARWNTCTAPWHDVCDRDKSSGGPCSSTDL